MKRKINERDVEYIQDRPVERGVSQSTINTLGGMTAENRGRRTADDEGSRRFDDSPFENGRLYNWNHRKGWDKYYDRSYDRVERRYGGGQLFHDRGNIGKGPKGYRRPDSSIYDDVCLTLEGSANVDASDIEVSVKDGLVYLVGSVRDRNEKRLAELEIENISGVKDVHNQLSLRNLKQGSDYGKFQ